MTKTINRKIFTLISILLFSCFCIFSNGSAVNEKDITVYSNVYNASTAINTEFEYKITPESSNPAGATNEPTDLIIKFDNVEPSSNLTTRTGKVDFSGTTFTQPGIYTYRIKEISSSNPDYQVSSEEYEVYVVVTNTTVVVYQQAKNLADDTKGNIHFNHEPEFSFITISEKTEGDAVDKRQYFRFKLEIDSLCIGCEYTILGQDEYVEYNGETIKTSSSYKVNTDGTPNYIYLKHGQSITIGISSGGKMQIPLGTKMRLIGDENLSSRKWTMLIDGREVEIAEFTINQPIEIAIVMERNMLVPNTGLFADDLPFVLLLMLGAVGIYSFRKLKVRNVK